EIAFADWIVRGIESGMAAPRFGTPLPEIVARLPKSRAEVVRRLDELGLPPGGSEQQRLWTAEAALGVHHLDAAARLGGSLRAVVIDDWLLDYEQYARAVGSAPSDAGRVWRLADSGWSRDPLVRLSVAAQALQC